MIREGTVPKNNNYDNFTLEPERLYIYFAPATVVSASEGIQEVIIPLNNN